MPCKNYAVATLIVINIAAVSAVQANVIFDGGAPDQQNGYFSDTSNQGYLAENTFRLHSSYPGQFFREFDF